MAFSFYQYGEGSLVRARRGLASGWGDVLAGRKSVGRGSTGIVRQVHPGLFANYYTVEFNTGLFPMTCYRVSQRDLKNLWSAAPEKSYLVRRDLMIGIRLGMLILSLWAIIQTLIYLHRGGTVSALVIAAINEMLSLLIGIVSFGGVGAILFIGAVTWLIVRRHRRS